MSKSISGTFAADGNSASVVVLESGTMFVGSTAGKDFGGGNIYLQAKGPDGNWYESGEAITTAVVRSLTFNRPTEVRLTLGSSTAPDVDYGIVSDTPEL
jgi:hypothetical protein